VASVCRAKGQLGVKAVPIGGPPWHERRNRSLSQSRVLFEVPTSLNFGVSASGGYGPVSITSTLSTTINASERQTRNDSANHAQQVTQRASTRSRKEQKVSFRVETRRGEETESARLIENKGSNAIRIDYYRMMRKWRVDLIRYGLRMTYDLVVPDPGSSLRKQILELMELDREIEQQFSFDVPITEVTRDTWMGHAARYCAAIEPPPPAWKPSDPMAAKPEAPFEEAFIPLGEGLEQGRANWTDYRSIRIAIPAGYVFRPEQFVGVWMSYGPTTTFFDVIGDEKNAPATSVPDTGNPGGWSGQYISKLEHLNGMSNDVTIVFKNRNIHTMLLRVRYRLQLSSEAWDKWQAAAWQRLREAAEQQHYTALQRKRDRRERLALELAEQDTLSLRRAEHEEIMKRALQWLLGPEFDVSPALIEYLLDLAMSPVSTDKAEPSKLNLNEVEWLAVRKFGEYIKFIHHAVEWENVLYFLYPYFWGSSALGELKRNLKHPDPFRREFIRAGAARVVLPIRPGFELRFASFIATGGIVPPNDNAAVSSPYVSIAEEMRAFARTKYPQSCLPRALKILQKCLQKSQLHGPKYRLASSQEFPHLLYCSSNVL
jgi:hypothetical protein